MQLTSIPDSFTSLSGLSDANLRIASDCRQRAPQDSLLDARDANLGTRFCSTAAGEFCYMWVQASLASLCMHYFAVRGRLHTLSVDRACFPVGFFTCFTPSTALTSAMVPQFNTPFVLIVRFMWLSGACCRLHLIFLNGPAHTPPDDCSFRLRLGFFGGWLSLSGLLGRNTPRMVRSITHCH